MCIRDRNGRIAHELIFDMREFKNSAHIEVEDIAKRLMDYGCLLYTSPSPRDRTRSRMPSSAWKKKNDKTYNTLKQQLISILTINKHIN